MKKTILTIVACLFAVILFAQTPAKQDSTKRDTIYQFNMNINQLRLFMHKIDANIDSKKVSTELLEFLKASAKMVQPAPAYKPKK